MGRKFKPTAEKKLAGKPGHRPLNDAEPIPATPSELPAPPASLDAVGKKEWREIGKLLLDLGLFTKIDRAGFAAYCEAVSTWDDATKKLHRQGRVIKGDNGIPYRNPYLAIQTAATAVIVKSMSEFGLSPAARSGIKIKRADAPPPPVPEKKTSELEAKYLPKSTRDSDRVN